MAEPSIIFPDRRKNNIVFSRREYERELPAGAILGNSSTFVFFLITQVTEIKNSILDIIGTSSC
jgi:galactokinase/mevalonate kinase-like predicted kinase